ncbi:thioredoxin domain-containing protein [Phenylobacterium sp.]|uniref:thioredoxin domain-containing protein n=1 Tax=Phenylobacterium sp. TaxID=1871053 RepID=UPI002734CD2F|nr:thioredoxin domain-containing protein [Phenylobacterium sp.]MDP3854064.1 thioredoxin domain-containing protein [Phenylobacterium sp.]
MNAPSRRIAIAAVLAAMAFATGPAVGAPAVGDMSLGDPKAKVKMVEYASLSCVHCAAFNNEVLPAFKKKYVDTGKVHYTLREVLTDPAPVAAAGFMTARCAGKANYFKVVDAAFGGFDEMARTGDARGNLLAAAKAGGMTEEQFVACISDGTALQALQTRTEKAAQEAGISGTPTFFFNGKKVSDHAMTAAELDAAVAAAAKASK